VATTRKEHRARLLQNQATAAAERRDRERLNITNLTEFAVQAANLEDVDDWLATRIEKAHTEAEDRRTRHRVAAGQELAALRGRGESVADIAGLAGISQAKVREYLKVAEDADTGETAKPAKAVGGPKASAARPESTEVSAPLADVVSVEKPLPDDLARPVAEVSG